MRSCRTGSPHVTNARAIGPSLSASIPVSTSSQTAWISVRCTSCTRAADACGTLTWMSGPPTCPAVPAREPDGRHALVPGRLRAPRARCPTRRWSMIGNRHVTRRARALPPVVRTRARNAVVVGTDVSTLVSDGSARAASPARSRSKRPTSSAAKCSASAALPRSRRSTPSRSARTMREAHRRSRGRVPQRARTADLVRADRFRRTAHRCRQARGVSRHDHFRCRSSRSACRFSANSSCVSCSGSYVRTGSVICTG